MGQEEEGDRDTKEFISRGLGFQMKSLKDEEVKRQETQLGDVFRFVHIYM